MADNQTFIVSLSLTINYELAKFGIYHTCTNSERTYLAFPKTRDLGEHDQEKWRTVRFTTFFQKFLQSLVLNKFASYILQIVTNIVEKSKMFRVD